MSDYVFNDRRGPDEPPVCSAALAARLAELRTRRSVLRGIVAGAAGVGLLAIAGACESDDGAGANRNADAEPVTVPSDRVPEVDGAPLRSEDGGFYLARTSDGVLAFSWRCTHQGCEVPWKDDERRFHCPCHGSVFDLTGARIDGPAKRPLDLVGVDVRANGDLVVDFSQITERSSYEPEQAIPYPDPTTGEGGAG